MPRLTQAVESVGAALLVIDPITNYLSETINSHNDASVRRALVPLADLAQQLGCCVLAVRHLNKQGDLKAKYRGGGSIAFTGAARSVMVVEQHPTDEQTMVMARVKNNLWPSDVPSIRYRIVGDAKFESPKVEWGDEIDLSADDLLHSPDARKDAPELNEAMDLLVDLLVDGPMLAKEVLHLTAEAGVSKKTVTRARKRLGIKSKRDRDSKTGKTQSWTWDLPH